MNEVYFNKLEFNKIKEIIVNKCITNYGKKLANNLSPLSDENIINIELLETTEAVNLIYKNGNINILNYEDTCKFSNDDNIQFYLKTIENNGCLSAKALLRIGNILKTAQNLKEYFFTDFINKDDFPTLKKYFSLLYSNPSITEKIFFSILDEEKIADNASHNLNIIRKQKRKIEQEIKDKLNFFIHSPSYSKYIQESIITLRNNRFVIPVKDEYKGKIKGFTHDISSSGSTIFIEPIAIFEMNNEINNLNLKENLEIEKILYSLTSLLFPFVEELKQNVRIIGKLDFIFSKANYSIELNAVCPKISNKKCINLINARHPLIDQSKVVPISLNLGLDYNLLVITGPNTGRKNCHTKNYWNSLCYGFIWLTHSCK